MRQKGSITVFLSLVLVLLFSFVLTALEAARIRGATAYISMLSELSGDSLKAYYYYPLFKEYRLFGVNAGDESACFSENKVEKRLQEGVEYGISGLSGGLFSLQNPELSLLEYDTLLSGEGKEFLAQVREQAVLEGVSLTVSELFDEQAFTDVALTGEAYKKQEESLTATATVTKELLELMELVDGIRTKNSGMEFDKNGRLQAKDAFIKQLLPMSMDELEARYQNEEVFTAIQDKFFRADLLASEVEQLAGEGLLLQGDIAYYDAEIADCKERIKELKELKEEASEEEEKEWIQEEIEETEAVRKTVSEERDTAMEQLDLVLMDAEDSYNRVRKHIQAVEKLYKDALKLLDSIEKKQAAARVSVEAYESFLEGVKASMSEKLYQTFEEELRTMKLYLGMEKQGYYVPTMRDSLKQNQQLLEAFSLSGFSSKNLGRVKSEMEDIAEGMSEYTAEGLWFTYGKIVAPQDTKQNVKETLEELLSGEILALVGLQEEKLSDRKLDGQELPSDGLEQTDFAQGVLESMESVAELFQEGEFQEVLGTLAGAVTDKAALELYCTKYFGCFGSENPYTKLAYEREYLVFGGKDDHRNLTFMVLYLIAIRTLFDMVSILKNPQKMMELQNFAVALVGFTGIPVLVSATKYAVLLLWAVEEAIVETTALLQGKKLPVISGEGMISFSELFLFSKELAAQKAAKIPEDRMGAGYEEYLLILSLTGKTKEKAYYAMDLIQENIRYRYNDNFRIRNCLIGAVFQTTAELKKKYDAGIFPEDVYTMSWTEECSY